MSNLSFSSQISPSPQINSKGHWWEGQNTGAELGVQLFITASKLGVEWEFEKDNPAAAQAPTPDLRIVTAEDDAGACGRPQKAPGDGAGFHTDPRGR